MYLKENKVVFFSVSIHISFRNVQHVEIFWLQIFKYLKENCEIIFYFGARLFLFLPFHIFTVICSGFPMYHIIPIQIMLQVLFFTSGRSLFLHRSGSIYSYKNGESWGNNLSLQDKAELKDICRSRGEIKLPWSKGKVCLRQKLFCETFSAFAAVIYSCIKKSFDLGVVFLKCPNLQGYMDNFSQVLLNMVLIMLKGL